MANFSGFPGRRGTGQRSRPRPLTSLRLWSAAGLLACALVSVQGCASFKAVQSTGALAMGLSGHADSISYIESICPAIQAATSSGADPSVLDPSLGIGQQSCADIGQDAEAWSEVVEALAGYGKALDGLAASEPVDLSAQLEGIRVGLAGLNVDSLGTERAKAAVGAASGLVALLLREIRRRKLQDTITAAAPHVRVTTKQLEGHLRGQLITLARLEDNLLNPAADFIAPGAAADVVVCGKGETEIECDARGLRLAMSASLFALQGWVHERRLALEGMRRAVKAFAVAHEVLADDVESLGREDVKHLAEIIGRVKTIYEQAKVATSPEAAGAESDPEDRDTDDT